MSHAPRTPNTLAGIHPVREALRTGRAVDRLLIARGSGGPRLQEIIELCRERGIPVRFEPREALDRASNNAHHQGIVAFAAPGAIDARRDQRWIHPMLYAVSGRNRHL